MPPVIPPVPVPMYFAANPLKKGMVTRMEMNTVVKKVLRNNY